MESNSGDRSRGEMLSLKKINGSGERTKIAESEVIKVTGSEALLSWKQKSRELL